MKKRLEGASDLQLLFRPGFVGMAGGCIGGIAFGQPFMTCALLAETGFAAGIFVGIVLIEWLQDQYLKHYQEYGEKSREPTDSKDLTLEAQPISRSMRRLSRRCKGRN